MLLVHETRPFRLSKILRVVQTMCVSQPHKHLKLNFTPSSISMSTLDERGTILIGVTLRKQSLASYILEKNTSLLIPLVRVMKIMELADDGDDTVMLIYDNCNTGDKSSNELTIRIYNSKKNEKLIVQLKIQDQFGDMISEKYQEPTNPIEYLQNLKKNNPTETLNTTGILPCTHCHFMISCMEFLRICEQFAEVSKNLHIKYESEANSNKKYLTLSAPSQNGIKSIVLNQEKSQQELQQLMVHYPSSQHKQIKEVLPTEELVRIARMSKNNEDLFHSQANIIIEQGKCVMVEFELLGHGGKLVALLEVISE